MAEYFKNLVGKIENYFQGKEAAPAVSLPSVTAPQSPAPIPVAQIDAIEQKFNVANSDTKIFINIDAKVTELPDLKIPHQQLIDSGFKPAGNDTYDKTVFAHTMPYYSANMVNGEQILLSDRVHIQARQSGFIEVTNLNSGIVHGAPGSEPEGRMLFADAGVILKGQQESLGVSDHAKNGASFKSKDTEASPYLVGRNGGGSKDQAQPSEAAQRQNMNASANATAIEPEKKMRSLSM